MIESDSFHAIALGVKHLFTESTSMLLALALLFVVCLLIAWAIIRITEKVSGLDELDRAMADYDRDMKALAKYERELKTTKSKGEPL